MGFLFPNIDKFTGLSPVIPPDILCNHSAANAGHVESMLAKFMSSIVFEHCDMIIVLLVRMINCIHLFKCCQVTAFPYLLLHYLSNRFAGGHCQNEINKITSCHQMIADSLHVPVSNKGNVAIRVSKKNYSNMLKKIIVMIFNGQRWSGQVLRTTPFVVPEPAVTARNRASNWLNLT